MRDFLHVDTRNINNRFFEGKVTDADPGTYVVRVAPNQADYQMRIISGIPLTSVITDMLGMKESFLPQIGAKVLCYDLGDNSCAILGCLPSPATFDVSYPLRTSIGAGDAKDDAFSQGYGGEDQAKLRTYNTIRPTDIVPGEYAISNEFGMLLGLFQQFGVLKASELAQIQVHVLDDLVRVVSKNFQHYHCLGETRIFHDGNTLQAEYSATHDPIESLGTPQVESISKQDAIVNSNNVSNDDSKNIYEVEDEARVAITRLKVFLGALGGFINMLFSRPSGDARKQDGKDLETPDKGLANFKVDMDGGLYLRSLKGIYLEKTNWIRVPQRIKSPEDPTGKKDFVITDKDEFVFDDFSRYENQPFLYFLQIRDYLAYIQDDLAYRDFKESGDFYVNDDPAKETQVEEINKVTPQYKTKLMRRTAGIYLMPNGGICLKDAWGSAIVMEGGNVYIQPAKDLYTQVARNEITKVGGFSSTAVNKDIDLSSTTGGLRIKTDKIQHLYSHSAGIILHSNATGPAEYTPTDDTIQHVGGIVLTAPKAGVFNYGKFIEDRATSVYSCDSDNVAIKGKTSCNLYADTQMALIAKTNIAVNADSLLMIGNSSALFMGMAATQLGVKGKPFGVVKRGKDVIGVAEGSTDPADFTDTTIAFQQLLIDFTDIMPVFKDDKTFDDLKFRFPTSSSYGISAEADPIPQTMSQQEDAQFGLHTYKKWDIGKLNTKDNINDTLPYPGKDLKDIFTTAGLNNLTIDRDHLDIYNNPECDNKSEIAVKQDFFESNTVF